MADFLHCNKCLVRPKQKPAPKFFITVCYHLLCEKCNGDGPPGTPCKLCNKPTRAVEINRDLDKRLQEMFMSPKTALAQRINALRKKQSFQKMMYGNIQAFYKKQRAKLEQASQYFQKQAVVIKGKDKEIEELKLQLTTLEQKMSLIETERENLQRQISELQKMETRASSDPFDSPMDSLFNSQPLNDAGSITSMFNLSQTFGDQGGFQAQNGSLNTSRDSDSIRLSMGSPCMSNSSVLSEVTTPKILGLSKGRSPSSSSVFYSSPRAAMNDQNPYMDMFNRTSSRNTSTPTTSRTPTFNMGSSNRSGSRSSSGKHNSSAYSPGIVARSSIIPKTNTPSANHMEF